MVLKVYISGPMTGLPEFNYPAFNSMAERIAAKGHIPLNPAKALNGEGGHPREAHMRADIAMVMEADAILLLPGWYKCKGSLLEVQIAAEIGLRIVELQEL